MFIAAAVATILLAVLLAVTAGLKFARPRWIVDIYARLGVPAARLPYLALILLAGAAGLLVGLWWAPLGVAAATGLMLYFVLAIGAHLRAGDPYGLPRPVALAVLAVVVLVLRLVTW